MGTRHKSRKKADKIPLPSGKLKEAAAAMREVRLAEISKLAVRGLTPGQIADRVGMDTTTVRRCLDEIERRWRDASVENLDQRKASILRELDAVKAEAWEEWERSKDDKFKQVIRTKTVTADTPAPASPPADSSSPDSPDSDSPPPPAPLPSVTQTETTTTREGRLGDPAYLRVVADCLDQQSRLLGLEVEKVAMTDPTGQQPYHTHVMGQLLAYAEECRSGPAVMSDSVIEGHVQAMLAPPPPANSTTPLDDLDLSEIAETADPATDSEEQDATLQEVRPQGSGQAATLESGED